MPTRTCLCAVARTIERHLRSWPISKRTSPTRALGHEAASARCLSHRCRRSAVDKLYSMLRVGGVVRQANYPIDVARRAWKVVARKYPAQFLIPNPLNPRERISLNPFVGVERVR